MATHNGIPADEPRWDLGPRCEANYIPVSHLSHREIWNQVRYAPFRCTFRLPKPRNRRWQSLHDSTTRMARELQSPKDRRETQESSLWSWTSSTAMPQRNQCLSTLSWVHTVFSRSQRPFLQRWDSDTSVCRRYPHVISGGFYLSREWCQSHTLREVQDHEHRPGTPIPRRRDLLRWQWYWNQSRSESLYHHNLQMIQHGA